MSHRDRRLQFHAQATLATRAEKEAKLARETPVYGGGGLSAAYYARESAETLQSMHDLQFRQALNPNYLRGPQSVPVPFVPYDPNERF